MSVQISNKKYAVLHTADIKTQDITITKNGNYYPSDGITGYNLVRVKVPEAVLQEITISPKTTEQTILPPKHVDGFDTVTVQPVTASIDSNIKADNIKKGVTILGVAGNVDFQTETLVVTPKTTEQNFIPNTDGYRQVTVGAVSASIDKNIKAENIRNNVEILGVKGIITPVNNTTRDVYVNGLYTAPAPYTGFSEVNVDVKIESEPLTIVPKITEQIFTPIDEYHGYSPITVKPVTAEIDSNIVAQNIKKGINILGTVGTCIELNPTTLKITKNGSYKPTAPHNGFSQVDVDINTVNNTDITITTNGTYTPKAPYTGFGKVITNIDTVNNTTLTAKDNGTYRPASPYTGYSEVTVDVSSKLTEKKVSPTDTVTILTPDTGMLGFSKVTVDLTWIEDALKALNAGDTTTTPKLQNKTVTQAGIYQCDNGYDGLGKVTVNLDWVDTAIEQAKTQAVSGTSDALIANNATTIITDADIIREYAFYKATNLKKVTLNNAKSISAHAFEDSGLQTLVIKTTTVCTLSTNVFTIAPTIYVPDNLLASYQTASNWVIYKDHIKAISTIS